MPNDAYIPTKNDQKEILNLLRIKEFVVCCSLDYDNHLSYNDKLLLSKYFVSRELLADQIRISRHFENNDENLYQILLEAENDRLRFLLYAYFKDDQENLENCYKKMNMHYEDFGDFMTKSLKHARGEKLNNLIFSFIYRKYGDDMFLYFKDEELKI